MEAFENGLINIFWPATCLSSINIGVVKEDKAAA
jgi:hypothetical protein